jgi:DUF1680 family protein
MLFGSNIRKQLQTRGRLCQYNALKIVRHLFRWNPTGALADDYERKLLNGVLGIQKPLHNGTMVYMSPLGKGVSRPQANWDQGWGTPDDSFWCCYGTAIESFAKLGDSIYFHHKPTLQLWIAQFISSDLRWADAAIHLTQKASYTPDSTALNFSIAVVSVVTTAAGGEKGTATAAAAAAAAVRATAAVRVESNATRPTNASQPTINIRIPSWAVPSRSSLTLNGVSLSAKGKPLEPGKFLAVTADFKAGDGEYPQQRLY